MRRRATQTRHTSRDRWLVSYADLITLLFAFFVVLYASAQVDKAKMGRLAAAIEGAFQQLGAFRSESTTDERDALRRPPQLSGAVPENALLAVAHYPPTPYRGGGATTRSEVLRGRLERLLAPEIERHEVALRMGPDGLVISLREVGFFDSGSAVLKASAEPTMAQIAELLRIYGVYLRVEGHTDDMPIHTQRFTSNWELSTARATELVKLLISQYAFPPNHLSAAGYGEFHPIASNRNSDGRRQNRRVDLVIVRGSQAAEAGLEVHDGRD